MPDLVALQFLNSNELAGTPQIINVVDFFHGVPYWHMCKLVIHTLPSSFICCYRGVNHTRLEEGFSRYPTMLFWIASST